MPLRCENLLNVIALADHISPPCQSESIMTKASSQDQLLLKVKGGHIGMMAGSAALKCTWPLIMNFHNQNRSCHAERSEASLCP